jgi:hypothetical protein
VTPIPDDVAAAIVAAGHSLSVETINGSPESNHAEWRWCRDGSVERPAWRVRVGDACGDGPTAREAVLSALTRTAAMEDSRESGCRAEAKRVRLPYRKAQETERADACAKRAAEVRALAERVAAMWPEVTP